MFDEDGSNDVLDMRTHSINDITVLVPVDSDGDIDSLADSLIIRLSGGNGLAIEDFLNNTATTVAVSGTGPGYLEVLRLAEGDTFIPVGPSTAAANIARSASASGSNDLSERVKGKVGGEVGHIEELASELWL